MQYKDKDAEEMQAIAAGDELMCQIFMDMQRAKRQQSLGRGQWGADNMASVPQNVLQVRVDSCGGMGV